MSDWTQGKQQGRSHTSAPFVGSISSLESLGVRVRGGASGGERVVVVVILLYLALLVGCGALFTGATLLLPLRGSTRQEQTLWSIAGSTDGALKTRTKTNWRCVLTGPSFNFGSTVQFQLVSSCTSRSSRAGAAHEIWCDSILSQSHFREIGPVPGPSSALAVSYLGGLISSGPVSGLCGTVLS